MFTTVDTLLLPGVIGTTVEGPKTPLRSPGNTRRYSNMLPIMSRRLSRGEVAVSPYGQTRVAPLGSSSASSETSEQDYGISMAAASSRYVDTEVDLEPMHTHRSNRGVFLSSSHHDANGTPQGKQYRKSVRPHDTPIAHSKGSRALRHYSGNNSSSRSNGAASAGLSLTSPYYYQQASLDDEDDKENKDNDPARLPLSSQQRHTKDYPLADHYDYEDEEEETHFRNGTLINGGRAGDGNQGDDNENALDIGGYEDEIYPHDRLRGAFYADPAIDAERTDGHLDDDDDDEIKEEDMAEMQREQGQLGFIKRLANLLRKQRDEYGWGTPKRLERQRVKDEEGVDSGSDSDARLTSARVRKESYKRRQQPRALAPIPSKMDVGPVQPSLVASNLARSSQLSVPRSPDVRRTMTPTDLRRTSASTELVRTSTPTELRRTLTPTEFHRATLPPRIPSPTLRRTVTPPLATVAAVRRSVTPPTSAARAAPTSAIKSDRRRSDPFTVPAMRQFDSGIGMTASQDSFHEHDFEALEEEEEEEEELDNEVEEQQQEQGYENWRTTQTATATPVNNLEIDQQQQQRQQQQQQHEKIYYESRREHDDSHAYMSADSDDEEPLSYGISGVTQRYSDYDTRFDRDPVYSSSWSSPSLPKPPPSRVAMAGAGGRVYPWHVLWRMLLDAVHQFQDLFMAVVETAQFLFYLALTWVRTILGWPWRQRHIVWHASEEWMQAGAASGLLSPGTLLGVALLCLAVWSGHQLGYGESASSSSLSGGDCHNGTLARNSPSPGVLLKDAVSDVWSKLTWPTGSMHSKEKRQSWTSWVPQVPSFSHWIPSSRYNRKEMHTNKIQIPTEQIQSFEELESAVKWIQKTLVELGQADETLAKELQQKFDGMSALVQRRLLDLGQADEQLSKELRTKFDGMSVWISGVEHKLNRVSEEVDSLTEYVKEGRWIEQTVLELIRDEIPKHLVVSKDRETGKLSIPEEFWKSARELFMTSEQVKKLLEERIAQLGLDQDEDEDQQSSGGSGGWNWGSSSNKVKAKAKNGKGVVSWDDFLSENEQALSSFVEGRMSKVSRSEFLSLVRMEANTIWQGLEKNVVALLEKQGKLQGKGAPRRLGYYRGSSSSTLDSQQDRALTDVERELISGLIDEALDKYSADAMAKPDYALFSAGGRIVPRLTFKDYHHKVEPTLWGKLGLQYVVTLKRRNKPAQLAIEPSMHAGECWAMEGNHGQLGIRLARRIVITEVTIEHADPSVVLDMDSAVKLVEIWGVSSKDKAPVSAWRAHDTSSSAAHPIDSKAPDASRAETAEQLQDEEEKQKQEREDSPWPGAVFLTSVEYNSQAGVNGTKPKTRQTFSIPLSKQTSSSDIVVLQIKSNWGHPNYTCLYRVRVHGYEPSA
ncbi:hypothetical protein EDD11_002273 [Mortierella claussenii]|nr:hypothetical protein EDD11_002273 [Mortierella claussenii]